MTFPNRVLIPLDGSARSEQAFPLARRLLHEATMVVLLHVVREDAEYNQDELSVEYPDTDRATVAKARAGLEMFVNQQMERGEFANRPKLRVETGDPASVILDIANAENVDLIVMTTRGHGAPERWFLGSVADRIVRSSPVPVCAVHPLEEVDENQGQVGRIIVPLDGSVLAEHALPLARELATRWSVPIVLVRAVRLDYLTMPTFESVYTIPQEIYDDVFQNAGTYLESVRQRLEEQGLTVSAVTSWGSPFDVIEASTRPDDLLMLTSHGRGGFGRWVMGSVADKLVRSSRVPVLLVPAPGRSGGGA